MVVRAVAAASGVGATTLARIAPNPRECALTGHNAVRRLTAAAIVVCAAVAPIAVAAQPATAEPADGRLLLLLDSSGSMKEPDASGSTKIEAARAALNTVVDRLPATAQVGLRVYGAKPLPASDPAACTDTDLVVPVGPADTAGLKRAIGGYRPAGETPIAYSLGKAAEDVGQSGPRTILLVSDGEESCKADPCAVARQLHAAGIDLKVDVVGMNVAAGARDQLACIADAGGGTYYDARDADQLTAAMNQSSLRAFKDFAVSGTPVQGTAGVAGAPLIGPGRYTDTIGQPGQADGRTKHYLVRRTPGSTVRAAVTARPRKRTGAAQTSEELKLVLLTPAGDRECTYANEAAFEWNETRDFLNTSVFLGPEANSAHSTSVPPECRDGDRLVLRVERAERSAAGSGAEDPIELVVVEEPPVDGAGALPEPVDGDGAKPAALPPSEPRGEAVGGGGFHDATPLAPGTWAGTLQPGERLFYRIRADWGQSVSVTVRFLKNPGAAAQLGQCGGNVAIALRAYAPDRAPISLPGGSDVNTGTTRCFSDEQVLATTLPEVRYRNRERTTRYVEPVSVAGDYYVAVQQNANDEHRYQDDIQVTVAVRGERAGVPAYRGADPSGTPAGARPPAERPNRLVPVAAAVTGGAAAGCLVIALLVLYRRRTLSGGRAVGRPRR
jgi:Ca-activated chloride channel homolog